MNKFKSTAFYTKQAERKFMEFVITHIQMTTYTNDLLIEATHEYDNMYDDATQAVVPWK